MIFKVYYYTYLFFITYIHVLPWCSFKNFTILHLCC